MTTCAADSKRLSGFQRLLGEAQWQSLPSATRYRFSQASRPGVTRCYKGRVTHASLSALGWLLAQLCRLVGAPLPLFAHCGAATVTVTDHAGNGGQVWARCYHRRRGFAQCIQSVKRFSGPTGLEEYLGWGLTMPLNLAAHGKRLEFRSAGYQLVVLGRRFALPSWLHPGDLTVIHEQFTDHAFSFEMHLMHPRWGCLVHQRAEFQDYGT